MAKLSDPQAKLLREIRDAGPGGLAVKGPTLAALRRRYLVAEAHGDADRPMCWRLGPSGRSALEAHERAEREAARQAERAARPVPASAFVEPSAKNAPVLDHEYEDEPEDAPAVPSTRAELEGVARDAERGIRPAVDMLRTVAERSGYAMTAGGWVRHVASMDNETHRGRVARGWREFAACVLDTERYTTQDVIAKALNLDAPEPSAPQAWIDQLAIFLRHGAKIRKVESGWYAEPGYSGFSLNHTPGRLDATVPEAIRRGIVRELPPTATGIIRLALAE